MSQESQEIVRRAFEAWNRGDEAAESHFALDVEIDASERVLNPAVYHGHEGAARFREEIAETWHDFHVEIEEMRGVGDQVVVLVHSSGQGRASGVAADARAAWLVTVAAGKVARLRLHRDRAEALALLERAASSAR